MGGFNLAPRPEAGHVDSFSDGNIGGCQDPWERALLKWTSKGRYVPPGFIWAYRLNLYHGTVPPPRPPRNLKFRFRYPTGRLLPDQRNYYLTGVWRNILIADTNGI